MRCHSFERQTDWELQEIGGWPRWDRRKPYSEGDRDLAPTGEQKANMLRFCTWFFERAQLR
jgi:hypothetical protein